MSIQVKSGKWMSRLASILGLIFFIVGLQVLYRELNSQHIHDVARHFSTFPKLAFLFSLVLTAVNFLVLAGYEWLGVQYVGKPLQYKNMLLASFIANALGNNLGAAAVSGTAIRYRMYSAWGLSAVDTAKVILFYGVTFFLGLVGIGGLTLIFKARMMQSFFHFATPVAHALGVGLLAIFFGYLAVCAFFHKPIQIREWQFKFPSFKTALGQTALSLGDWVLASAALYVLLPDHAVKNYFIFLSLFVAGQVLGMISQVPAGLGVFDAFILSVLKRNAPADEIFVSLLYYRFVYYILPLLVSMVCLAVFEFNSVKTHIKRLGDVLGSVLTPLTPLILSFSIFLAGAVLLFSGATPAVGERLAFLDRFLPLPAIEASHFLGSLIGVALLFLAHGILRRLDAAYYLTLVLLGLGMAVSLVKGLDYEEALILMMMLLLLLPCRSFFYRKASLFGEAFSPTWLVSTLTVISASLWLGFFAFKHVDYSHDLWWQFSLHGEASRFMRAIVGSVALAAALSIANLLRIAAPRVHPPAQEDLNLAVPIVRSSNNPNAWLALSGDKNFLFSSDNRAFIMFGVHGKSWVALGDPVGPEELWPELITGFRGEVDRQGGTPVFSEVETRYLPLYLDAGFTLFKLGEEARVPLKEFNLEGGEHKEFRHTWRHLEKEGVVFEVLNAEQAVPFFPEMKKVSDAWLAGKNTREKGFSLGFFHEDYLKYFPFAVMKKDGRLVAFANLQLGAGGEEISIDLMRYDPDTAPKSSMDGLFLHLMLWARDKGYSWFNLGMAPLSGLENREFAPLWNRLGALIFSRGEYFYNFEGLRAYKEKYHPVWEPKYLALPSGFSVPGVLADIAALNSGGLKGIFSK